MSAIIMEYKYEHSGVSMDTQDYEEFDYVVISVFDKEVKRIAVPCWHYISDGEREVCERVIIKWLQGNLDGG